jgi:hypothetical protein
MAAAAAAHHQQQQQLHQQQQLNLEPLAANVNPWALTPISTNARLL